METGVEASLDDGAPLDSRLFNGDEFLEADGGASEELFAAEGSLFLGGGGACMEKSGTLSDRDRDGAAWALVCVTVWPGPFGVRS